MNLQDLINFSAQEESFLKEAHVNIEDLEKRVYAHVLKLSEEVGELSEAILNHFSRQRISKKDRTISLENELADVIIVTTLIGSALGLDIEKALQNKIRIIIKRRNNL